MERWGNLSAIIGYSLDSRCYINTCILGELAPGMES